LDVVGAVEAVHAVGAYEFRLEFSGGAGGRVGLVLVVEKHVVSVVVAVVGNVEFVH